MASAQEVVTEITDLMNKVYSKIEFDDDPANQMIVVHDAFMHFMIGRMTLIESELLGHEKATDPESMRKMYAEFAEFASARIEKMNAKARVR